MPRSQVSGIDPNSYLPINVALKNIDHYLYKVGFSLLGYDYGRTFMNKPFMIIMITVICMIERSISMFTEDRELLALLSEFGHGYGIKVHWDLFLIMLSMMGLLSLLVYKVNKIKKVEPTFLIVFKMIAGEVVPRSIGLNKVQNIKFLLMLCKLLKILAFNNKYTLTVAWFVFYVSMNYFNLTNGWTITSVIINGVIHSIWLYYMFNIIYFQFFHLYILCQYLIMKIKNINEVLVDKLKRRDFIHIRDILVAYNDIFNEIEEYNRSFWSKILIIVWFFYGSCLAIAIFCMVFANLHIILRVLMFYFILIATSFFVITINKVSSVNSTAEKSYKVFQKFIAHYMCNYNGNNEILYAKNMIKVRNTNA